MIEETSKDPKQELINQVRYSLIEYLDSNPSHEEIEAYILNNLSTIIKESQDFSKQVLWLDAAKCLCPKPIYHNIVNKLDEYLKFESQNDSASFHNIMEIYDTQWNMLHDHLSLSGQSTIDDFKEGN